MKILTPEMLREFTIVSKTEAGLPLQVVKSEELDSGAFAEICYFAIPTYTDARRGDIPGNFIETCTISIVNKISIDSFHKTKRPEMDWSRVPEESIYKFLLFHEISHFLYDLNPGLAMREFPGNEGYEKYCFAMAINEKRADEYAWSRLFPKKRMPKKHIPRDIRRKINSFLEKYGHLFRSTPRIIKPLPIDDWAMVPVKHMRKGIPFYDEKGAAAGTGKR